MKQSFGYLFLNVDATLEIMFTATFNQNELGAIFELPAQ